MFACNGEENTEHLQGFLRRLFVRDGNGYLWFGFFSLVSFWFGVRKWGGIWLNVFGLVAWRLRDINGVIRCQNIT